MLNRNQKIYGYVYEDNTWKEFDSWYLRSLSEVEYREWKYRHDKRIHVNRNIDSPLIYFNRGHNTFSYFSVEDNERYGNSGPVTLSHVLRQKKYFREN